jgi:hypothetical protein
MRFSARLRGRAQTSVSSWAPAPPAWPHSPLLLQPLAASLQEKARPSGSVRLTTPRRQTVLSTALPSAYTEHGSPARRNPRQRRGWFLFCQAGGLTIAGADSHRHGTWPASRSGPSSVHRAKRHTGARDSAQTLGSFRKRMLNAIWLSCARRCMPLRKCSHTFCAVAQLLNRK